MLFKKKQVLNENQFIQVKTPRFLTAKRQKTIKNKIMVLSPSSSETGVVFRRRIKNKISEIKASFQNVKSTRLCTLLSDSKGNSVSTVEHILSALYALEIDNVYIDIDSNEIPVYDGSALEFVKKLNSTGTSEIDSYKRYIKINKNIEVTDGNKKARVSPFDSTLITTEIEYDHKMIGKQTISLVLNPSIYQSQICSARTFGFLNDVENLRKSGLAIGGSLENAIVLDEEKILNKEGLRFSDEFVRHKLLDFIGDISLSGYRILGSFFTSHTGHELNYKLIKKIFESPDNWELVYSN